MLICITVVWGLTFALVKESLSEVGPFLFMAWRFGIAAVVVGVFCMRKVREIDRRLIGEGLILGVLLYASYTFQTFGLKYTTAGNAGFITGLFIVFTPILATVFLKHRPDMKSVTAVIIALVGLAVLSLQPSLDTNFGDALVLVCAFSYSVHIILLDGYAKRNDLILLTFVQMLVVALGMTGSAALFEDLALPPSGFVWMSILICAVLASAAAFYVQAYAQRILTPVRTSMVLIMEPVFSVIFGILLLGETLTWRSWLGCALIFAGMIITEIPLRRIDSKVPGGERPA